jgi:MFS superfamily sulfate permease-like transporter
VVIIACNRIAAKIPGALFAVVAMIVVSVAFHLEKMGVKVVGEMASGVSVCRMSHGETFLLFFG